MTEREKKSQNEEDIEILRQKKNEQQEDTAKGSGKG